MAKKEKICMKCAYRVWAVALGLGLICSAKANQTNNVNFRPPNRNYSCKYFTPRKTGREKK